MVSRDEAARILKDEVARKKAAYQRAHAAFEEAAVDIPSGSPTPDGTERLIAAGKTYRFTLDAYYRAVREYNDLVLTGNIPERLCSRSREAVKS